MTSRFSELIFDCADPSTLARFWAAVLGYQVFEEEEDTSWIRSPEANRPIVGFQKVPEPKSAKNRLHIDVSPSDRDQDEEVERIIGLGARRIDIGQGESSWVVLADPEGNEFCVLRTRQP